MSVNKSKSRNARRTSQPEPQKNIMAYAALLDLNAAFENTTGALQALRNIELFKGCDVDTMIDNALAALANSNRVLTLALHDHEVHAAGIFGKS